MKSIVPPPPSNPCEGIRIPESGKFLLAESGTLGFGIRNTAAGIRNPANDGIAIFHWRKVESGIHDVESMVQDCLSRSITWDENQAALLSHIKIQLPKSSEISILTQPSNVKDKKKAC